MPSIKGFKIIKGKVDKNTEEQLRKLVKMPFEATNWKSQFNSDLVKGGKELSKDAPKLKEEPIAEQEIEKKKSVKSKSKKK